MNKLYNKHGPDPEIGYKVARHSSDCTGRMLRDRTGRMPCDGTLRASGIIVISHFNLIAQLPGGYQIRGKTQFRRRKTMRKNRPLGPVMGEVRLVHGKIIHNQQAVFKVFKS